MLKQIKREITEYRRSTIDPRTFVILDDCLYDNTWSRDKLMRLLFMNGRHWKVMLIISMQHPLGIPPIHRIIYPYYGTFFPIVINVLLFVLSKYPFRFPIAVG